MSMVNREEKNGDTLIVKPEGRLDTLTTRELEAFLKDRYDQAQSLVLDFENVTYISSAGLRLVIQAHKIMKEKDGLVVRNVSPEVRKVFEVTGYVHVVKFE